MKYAVPRVSAELNKIGRNKKTPQTSQGIEKCPWGLLDKNSPAQRGLRKFYRKNSRAFVIVSLYMKYQKPQNGTSE